MPLLVVNLLDSFSHTSKNKGFSLFEVVIVSIIIAMVSAIAVPNLIASQRQKTVNRTYSQIRSTLTEAQINANRLSTSCPINISVTEITSSQSGCVLEKILVDSSIVDIISSAGTLPQTINFSYLGTTGDGQTLQISRKTFTGEAIPETGKCIVVSSIGMIRTGVYNASAPSKCENPENKRYVP
jgi:prepilin-type N-terminal cleavage/methylation domain-containing protein